SPRAVHASRTRRCPSGRPTSSSRWCTRSPGSTAGRRRTTAWPRRCRSSSSSSSRRSRRSPSARPRRWRTSTDMATVTGSPRPAVAANRPSRRRWWGEVGWRYVVALLAIVYAVWPIVYILSASLSERGTLTGSNRLFAEVSTNNYAGLADTYFWTWLGNTVVIASVTAVGTVLMGAAAAYAFSRFRFSGRRVGLIALLIVQMFPQLLAFVAIFLLL